MQLIFYCHSLLVASNLSDARRMVNFHKLITSEFHQQGCESAGAPSKCKSELLKQNFCFCKLFHQCIHFCSDKGLKRGFQSLHMSFCAVLQNPNCKSLDVIKDSWNKEGKSTKNVYCSGQLLFLNSWIHLSTFYVIVSLFSIWMTDQQQYKQNCPTQWLYHILSPSTKNRDHCRQIGHFNTSASHGDHYITTAPYHLYQYLRCECRCNILLNNNILLQTTSPHQLRYRKKSKLEAKNLATFFFPPKPPVFGL